MVPELSVAAIGDLPDDRPALPGTRLRPTRAEARDGRSHGRQEAWRERLAAERLLAETVRATGTVRRFDEGEGYGFVCADEGDDDLLFPSTSIAGGDRAALSRGARVEFEVRQGPTGLEACSVVLIKAAAEGAEPHCPRAAETHPGSSTPPQRRFRIGRAEPARATADRAIRQQPGKRKGPVFQALLEAGDGARTRDP